MWHVAKKLRIARFTPHNFCPLLPIRGASVAHEQIEYFNRFATLPSRNNAPTVRHSYGV